MATAIPINERSVATFCRKWKISEFALFGSVLRDDFHASSDVDILVTFAKDADFLCFQVDLRKHFEQIRTNDDFSYRTAIGNFEL